MNFIFVRGCISRPLVSVMAFLCAALLSSAQSSGSITVGGDINTFYPVAWSDGNYASNRSTSLHIGRSNVHLNSQWRGALIANFSYHTTNWGNGANFIDADLSTSMVSATVYKSFIAGWQDATGGNGDRRIIIWLRGGGTTYYYAADAAVNPAVYDGVQNALPYVSSNGSVSYDVKTTIDNYVNSTGKHMQRPLQVYTTLSNYVAGNLGIGKANATEKLEVNGNIRAKEIKVETANWPDYVFRSDYPLLPIASVKQFISNHGHLPEVPNAAEVAEEGLSVGEMNTLLMKKVEELTLYIIELEERIGKLEKK